MLELTVVILKDTWINCWMDQEFNWFYHKQIAYLYDLGTHLHIVYTFKQQH